MLLPDAVRAAGAAQRLLLPLLPRIMPTPLPLSLLMSDFSPGQRWLSETETELGLGIVEQVDYRLVTIFFPACDEQRSYARHNAPLARLLLEVGDTLTTAAGQQLQVTAVELIDGIAFYLAHPADQPDALQRVSELQLGHQLDLRTANERLFTGQLDSSPWFALRHAAMIVADQLARSPVRGLLGPRVELLGHQLHIAHSVGQRFAPRVLLADEVGLGKTIEAGMILHQQLRTGRAQRALLVVPPALVHQWFVEMVRRFNLHFSIFDAERVAALTQPADPLADDLPGQQDDAPDAPINPFSSEQLVLISSDFLLSCNEADLLAAGWDMLVVDEAHHLAWQPDAPGAAYQRVEKLAAQTRGVLLLTATPEQLGQASHYARLRLLDPDRYPSLAQFVEEQGHYREIAALAAELHDQPQWSETLRQQAARYVHDVPIEETHRAAILTELIDRSGTGRVLFRNTRKQISGFPRRHAHPVPLPLPAAYQQAAKDGDALLPETAFADDQWCELDSRAAWLVTFLREHRRDKVLVICARRNSACDLHAWLSYRHGLSVAVFHEQLDLIARDRAAAWFAESEDGAQALICSEIGSEGRNFQFAQHLVLFDLPRNPDLLEQRIGRLDRIGQQSDIHIHLPYFSDHPQAVLLHWYLDGMDAFRQPNAAGGLIWQDTADALSAALATPADKALLDTLLAVTQHAASAARSLLEQGRDRLLELSSCDNANAAQLIAAVEAADAHSPLPFLEQVFECYGVEQEAHSDHAWIFLPGAQMAEPFPGLPDDGITVTDQRALALSRDDMQFLTLEHPLLENALDLVLSGDRGKACVALLKNKRIPAGTLLLECLFRVEVQAPKHLQAERFLPHTLLRQLLDARGKDLSASVAIDALSRQCRNLDSALARKIVSSQRALLETLIARASAAASNDARALLLSADQTMRTGQQQELDRLRALRERNPAIPETEVLALQAQQQALSDAFAQGHCQLAAVRVIVVSDE